jgi:aryl-alcohol dehydrogenase-like predicted oxidoreductase
VLAQPFPVIAVIGPHSEAHLQASLEGLEPAIGPEAARWLNLGCER